MQEDAREPLIVSAMIVFGATFLAASCRSAPPPEPSEPPLITRQSEPMVPRPSHPSAEAFEVTEELRERVALAVDAEHHSNEVLDVVGLAFPDGEALIVTHLSYPYATMTDEALDAAYDEAIYHRCQDEFSGCSHGSDECDEAAYDACVRTAYTNEYMYAALHLILSCGILHVSRYDASAADLRLVDRVVLETMACHLEQTPFVPAAEDVDLDQGPEIAFTYAFTGIERHERDIYTEALTIVDASDLHVQARLQMRLEGGTDLVTREQEGQVRRLGHVTLADRTGDGLPDLVSKKLVSVGQFCPEVGWTASPDLLVAGHEADVCEVTVTETVLPYDPAKDVWLAAEKAP